MEECLRRNDLRPLEERVPDKAILGTYRELQLSSMFEGFDEMLYVRLERGRFLAEEWSPNANVQGRPNPGVSPDG